MKVNDKYFDEIFDFAGQWDMPSKCGLKVEERNGKYVILVTELYKENPGTSITYAGGSLIKQICEAKNLDYNDIIYIECNPEMGSKLSFYDEECFLVTFEVIDNIPCNLKYNTISSDELSKYVSI